MGKSRQGPERGFHMLGVGQYVCMLMAEKMGRCCCAYLMT